MCKGVGISDPHVIAAFFDIGELDFRFFFRSSSSTATLEWLQSRAAAVAYESSGPELHHRLVLGTIERGWQQLGCFELAEDAEHGVLERDSSNSQWALGKSFVNHRSRMANNHWTFWTIPLLSNCFPVPTNFCNRSRRLFVPGTAKRGVGPRSEEPERKNMSCRCVKP